MGTKIKKIKIGLVPSTNIDMTVFGKRNEVCSVHVFDIDEEFKESKIDIVLIPDNIGLNPYSNRIRGWSFDKIDHIAHRFLAKNLNDIIKSQVKVLGLGQGGQYLYEAIGLYLDFDTWGGRANLGFVETKDVEYIRNKEDKIRGFVYRNWYGIYNTEVPNNTTNEMWERLLMDCFNDPLEGAMILNPEPPTPSAPDSKWID